MLVLTRKIGEAIVIGEDVRVTVLSVQGERVRIGVTAPGSVRVDREEVHERRSQFLADSDAAAAKAGKRPINVA